MQNLQAQPLRKALIPAGTHSGTPIWIPRSSGPEHLDRGHEGPDNVHHGSDKVSAGSPRSVECGPRPCGGAHIDGSITPLNPGSAVTRATEAVRFPFGQPAALQAPPEFAVLRAERPVQRVQMPFGGEGWLVTRYADSKFVGSDPRFSRAATVNADIPRSSPQLNPPGHLSAMDPPEHSRLRRLVGGAFTVKAAQRWRSRTEQIAGDLITGLLAKGAPVDLVDNFSLPLPITVICELLGVPKEDRRLFERVSQAVPGTSAVTDEQAQAACDELICYLAQHISARRDQPDGARPDDLLTTLIQAPDPGDRLSEAELINMGCVIIIGGHQTTPGSTSHFFYTPRQTPHCAPLAP